MAEEKVILDVEVKGTGKGEASIKSLKGELRSLKNELGQLDPASEAFSEAAKRAEELKKQLKGVNDALENVDPEKAVAPVKSLKAELRELKNELGKLDPSSDAFIRAAKRAGQLQEQIRGVNDAIENADPEKKFAPFSRTVAGLAGGFSAAQGAMALFGSESADLQKTLVKVQGAMALSQGLNSLLEFRNDFKDLGKLIVGQVVKAFSTLRGAIIATGIGALVVGIGLLIANWEKVVQVIDKVIPGFKKFTDSLSTNTEALEKNIEANKEAQGFYKKIIDARIAGIKDLRDRETADLKEKQRREKQEAQREYSSRADFNTLMLALEQQHLTEQNELSKKFSNEDDKVKKEKHDKAKQEAEKRLKDEQEIFAKRLSLLQENLDVEQELVKTRLDTLKKEIEDIVTSTDASVKQIEELKNNALKSVEDTSLSLETRQQILDEYLKAGYVTQKEYANAEIALEKEKTNQKMAFLDSYASILSSFSQLLGQQSAEGKALAITATTIDTFVAAQRAYTAAAKIDPLILAPLAAGAAVVSGLANVKRIMAVQVPGGGGNGGSIPSAPSIPQISSSTSINQNNPIPTTQLNVKDSRVYVVETDITDSQNKVKGIVRKATIR